MTELNSIWNSGKGKLPEDKLMAYLQGKLPPEEQHEVEAWLAEEGMEADALEGLKELPASETSQLVNKLNYQLRAELNKKPRRRSTAIAENKWTWLAIIIILLLCIAGYVVLHLSTIPKATEAVVTNTAIAQHPNKFESSTRFVPKIWFNDVKVDVYKGKLTEISLETQLARMYRVRITETYNSEGVNFAGHYCFISWGCGSPCKMSAIVDAQTGKVYPGPNGTLGYTFKADSRMLLLNKPEDGNVFFPKAGYYDSTILYAIPEIWIWEEGTKEFQQKQVGSN